MSFGAIEGKCFHVEYSGWRENTQLQEVCSTFSSHDGDKALSENTHRHNVFPPEVTKEQHNTLFCFLQERHLLPFCDQLTMIIEIGDCDTKKYLFARISSTIALPSMSAKFKSNLVSERVATWSNSV